tara:strand:- start:1004 stop:1870 length:867 start_codon:yes stop_codon:yes gene_type:complete
MRIMITGAYGQLGYALSKRLAENHDVIRTGSNIPKYEQGIKLNILNQVYMSEVIKSTLPDLIINLAAMTNVDGCEKNPDAAREVNIAGVQHLCDTFNGKIIHLSTDYVFDGKSGPYSEDDDVNPINIYGETKLASERILMDNNSDNLVIRANVLYDESPFTNASFLNWVISSLRAEKAISVVDDQSNNPTWTSSISDIISLCIDNSVNGIMHWGDADYLTRIDFANKIAKKYELSSALIKPVSTKSFSQIASRPLKSGLKSDKLINLLNVVPPTIDECLDAILEEKIK